ncbi:MAG: hypothetical protein Q9213_001403 [Squamulea squamosa]
MSFILDEFLESTQFEETKKQTERFPRANYRGYTQSNGYEQACSDFKKHLASNPHLQGNLIEDFNPASLQLRPNEPAPTVKEEPIVVYAAGRSLQLPGTYTGSKRAQSLQSTDSIPATKRHRPLACLPSKEWTAEPDQQTYKGQPTANDFTKTPVRDDVKNYNNLHESGGEGRLKAEHASDPFSTATDFISFCDTTTEDEFDCKSLDEILNQTFTYLNRDSEPRLCEEQMALIEIILSGRNIFYTGSAGSGKSTGPQTLRKVSERNGQGRVCDRSNWAGSPRCQRQDLVHLCRLDTDNGHQTDGRVIPKLPQATDVEASNKNRRPRDRRNLDD